MNGISATRCRICSIALTWVVTWGWTALGAGDNDCEDPGTGGPCQYWHVGSCSYSNLSVSITGELIHGVERTFTLSASVSPDGGTYTWSVSGDALALAGSSSGKTATFEAGEEAGSAEVRLKYKYRGGECSTTVTVHVVEVEAIKVSSEVADNSPQFFEGHKPHPFDPSKGVLLGGPGQHLVIFFKDVVDANLNVQDFDIELEAIVLSDELSDEMTAERWQKASGPSSGGFDRTDSFEVTYQNPKEGGVYRFEFRLGFSSEVKSEANVVLPLAGAAVDSVISDDIARANAFAALVVSRYQPRQRILRSNLMEWFVYNAAGDYLGRPDHYLTPTLRLYNQVIGNEDPGNEKWGWGAVCTWRGQPVRIGKISNFITAYGLRKVADIRLVGWAASRYRGEIGTVNDQAADDSWNAGWDVAGGADYDTTTAALVKSIFDKADGKNEKLWPNPYEAINYVSPSSFSDPDIQFKSPGYLYMRNP